MKIVLYISASFAPYTKIRGNAGIQMCFYIDEVCFYIDAVNRELLHRCFFFLFDDREAIMNVLSHILYDDTELIEEFLVNGNKE